MGDGTDGFLIRMDLGEGQPRGIVNADMDLFPTESPAVGLAFAIPCDPVPGALEPPQALEIEVDQFARVGAFVAAYRFGRSEIAQAAQTGAAQNPTDRGRRNAGLVSDMHTPSATGGAVR